MGETTLSKANDIQGRFGVDGAVSNYNERGNYRMPKPLNVTLITYAILGVDGNVVLTRKYPPGRASKNVVPVPDNLKVRGGIGWRYVDGEFSYAP